MHSFVKCLSVIFLVPLLNVGVCAEISDTSGAVSKISPPPSVVGGALESDTIIYSFDEQQGVTLRSPLTVDYLITSTPFKINGGKDAPEGTLSAGMVINSHYFHFDPERKAKEKNYIPIGSATFVGEEIIAVIVTTDNLIASNNILGDLGTAYAPSGELGIGLEKRDFLKIDTSSLDITLAELSGADNFRVLTVSIPEPSTYLIITSGLLLVYFLAHRKKKNSVKM